MNGKMKVKVSIDVLMTLLLLAAMAWQITGEKLHEWIGAGMFLLFIVHHVLNYRWWSNLLKGRYTPYQILQMVLAILLFVNIVVLMVSGIMLSRHVFAFLSIKGSISLARTLHLLAAYWGFMLMAFHLGIHWGVFVNLCKKLFGKKDMSKLLSIVGKFFSLLIAVYGIYSFINRDLWQYMTLQNKFVFFDYEESAILFLMDYLAIMGACIYFSYHTSRLIQKMTIMRGRIKGGSQ